MRSPISQDYGKYDRATWHNNDLNIKRSFRNRLKLAMQVLNLSGVALSKGTGVSPAAISNHLRGNTLPNDVSLIRYAARLGVTEAWLTGRANISDAPFKVPDEYIQQHTKLPTFLRPNSKNIATDSPLFTRPRGPEIPIDNPFKVIGVVDDSVWQGTGIWLDAHRAMGDEYFAWQRNYAGAPKRIPDHWKMRIGENIRNRCEYLGEDRPIDQLAIALNKTRSQPYRYYSGRLFPSIRTLFVLAVALKMTPPKLEEGVRDGLELNKGSAATKHRRLHRDIEAIMPEPVPETEEGQVIYLTKLAKIAKDLGPNSPAYGDYCHFWDVFGFHKAGNKPSSMLRQVIGLWSHESEDTWDMDGDLEHLATEGIQVLLEHNLLKPGDLKGIA